MRRRIAALAPVWLGAAWLASFFLPLLSPRWALANRDVPLFHLPLRTAFRELAASGLPVWNPWLHGGQPILSNPSYAAFYPPSWLAFAVPPAYALNLLAVLHAGIAFAGAWRLARRLGTGRGAAALAALGYTGSGALLSLLSAYTLFCSMAWFPWVLAAGDAALRSADRRGWLRPALACGGALALQLLNGEPVTVVVSGLGLLCLAASAAARNPRAAPRVLVPVAAALALAAIQLVPTLGRLADSPRAGGVEAGQAATWSAPPARLVELVFPRFFGDPARPQAGAFFGWNLHDRDYPYVASLYPGLLLTVLGVCALALWPIPRRGAWALAIVLGAFLALGRHNPLFEPLRQAVPLLAALRYPEKFAILAVACLGFAGALGWQRLLDERRAGRYAAADFPLALALVLLATATTLTALLYLTPRAALWFIHSYGGPDLQPRDVVRGLAYLRGEGWAAVATAAAVAALLALCRWRRAPERVLLLAAVGLLAADLWHYGHGLVATIPAEAYREPPPLARAMAPMAPGSRVWVEPAAESGPELIRRGGDPRRAIVRALLGRLEPYSGTLWGHSYAMHEDYDLMLTRWARLSLSVAETERRNDPEMPEMFRRYLGAWNVGTLLVRKPQAKWAREVARDPDAPPVRPEVNPRVQPRIRFAPRASFHESWENALYAARSRGYLAGWEHCIRPGDSRHHGRLPGPAGAPRRGRHRRPHPATLPGGLAGLPRRGRDLRRRLAGDAGRGGHGWGASAPRADRVRPTRAGAAGGRASPAPRISRAPAAGRSRGQPAVARGLPGGAGVYAPEVRREPGTTDLNRGRGPEAGGAGSQQGCASPKQGTWDLSGGCGPLAGGRQL